MPTVAWVAELTQITVAAPPAVAHERGGARARWVPLVAVLVGAGVLVALAGTGVMSTHGAGFAAFPAIMLVSVLASVGFGASRSAGLNRDRDDYLAYLEHLAAELTDMSGTQRDRLLLRYPEPAALVGGPVWQCCGEQPDFGWVRIGTGAIEADPQPVRGDEPGALQVLDPVTESALQQFLSAYAVRPDMPVALDLLGASAVSVTGAGPEVRAVLRAVLCGLAATHAPGAVLIAVALDDRVRGHWDWLKWLPHNRHPDRVDERGPVPMFFDTVSAALEMNLPGRHLVVLADGVQCDSEPEGRAHCTVIGVDATRPGDLQLVVTAESVCATSSMQDRTAAPDWMTVSEALACARRMAGCPVDSGQPGGAGWLAQMGIPTVSDLDPVRLWRKKPDLCIPLGLGADDNVVELDIKESALRGMGPHGLCIGATGSGKSELLRTIALGMIARHPPEELNLILVDFKGGATFLGLDRVNHVSAVITNLADEAHLVDRMQDALTGELSRRQRVLRAAGNLAGIADYRRARASGRELSPLPTLLVIVDEFSELLSHHPEFADVFAAIGRLGRSLGVHLLLASQRLDEGRLRGLESHLSYRICLKTLSAGESRAMLGISDAYQLPGVPGAAYLKVGAEDPVRFQAGYVSGPVDTAATRPAAQRVPVVFDSTAPRTAVADESAGQTGTLVDAVLAALAGHGTPAHRIWLPPLLDSPPLDAVLAAHPSGALRIPIGLVDQVVEQRRVPMTVDLRGSTGNVAVVGGPQSGKSAVLRTLALALAATHDPGRIQLYCLDFGGGGLGPLKELPHVGCVASRRDTDLTKRCVAELTALVRYRDSLFARHGVESIAEYRRRRATGEFGAGDPYGDAFLIVDGWATLRQEQDALESEITALAVEGLSLGVHVVLATSRWADLRPALKDQLGTRIELRLADPLDSEIDRRAARNVPAGRPGQGLAAGGAPLTVAVPRLDGIASAVGLADAAAAAGAQLCDRYPGQRAPRVKVLPAQVELAAVCVGAPKRPAQLVLGIDDKRLQPTVLDFDAQPHLLIVGDRGCGKTATLRALAHQLAGTARLVVLDPRRTMTGVAAADHLTDVAELPAMLAQRGTPARTFVLVDDYEVLAASNANPLAPLSELLPRARDIGLHLIIARRSAGAGRAMYEPGLAAVRENDAFGLQMSASADEGPLLATGRPLTLPPGRAILLSRAGGEQLIQVAWCAP